MILKNCYFNFDKADNIVIVLKTKEKPHILKTYTEVFMSAII